MRLHEALMVLLLLFVLAAAVIRATGCTPSDTPTPTHTAQDTTVYVFPDTVYIMQPDTMIWRGRSYIVDDHSLHAHLCYFATDTTFTHEGLYHGYQLLSDTLDGKRHWWEATGDPFMYGRLERSRSAVTIPGAPERRFLQMYGMTGAVYVDSAAGHVIKETGGRP
jgi:hypothetical protein